MPLLTIKAVKEEMNRAKIEARNYRLHISLSVPIAKTLQMKQKVYIQEWDGVRSLNKPILLVVESITAHAVTLKRPFDSMTLRQRKLAFKELQRMIAQRLKKD